VLIMMTAKAMLDALSDHYAATGSVVGAQTSLIAAQLSPPPAEAPWWLTWALSACITVTPAVISIWREYREHVRERKRNTSTASDDAPVKK
jgi:hypothetical protein